MIWLSFSLFLIIGCHTSPSVASEDFATLSRDTLQAEYGSIEYAGLIFRHGNRIPEKTYPKDPLINYTWPFELAQLTNEGKNTAYTLGKFLKPRYKNLTGNSYRPSKVIMHASSYDRTIMSGLLFYAGYFPPVEHEVWNEQIKWQPIPIHSAPASHDNIIRLSRSCPRYEALRNKYYSTSQFVKNLCAQYGNMIAYIEKHSGLNLTPCASYESMTNLIWLQDTIVIEDQNNLTLPEWTKEVYPEPLNTLRALLMYPEMEDLNIKRLLAGPLLNVLASDMLNIAHWNNTLPKNMYTSEPSDTRPLHLFSAHDVTIVLLMRALNVYKNESPEYSAGLSFELRKKDKENYYVTLIYKNSFSKQLQKIDITNCPGSCSLSDFLALIKPLIPEDWEAECKNDYVESTGTNAESTGVPNSAQKSTFWNHVPSTWKTPTLSPPVNH